MNPQLRKLILLLIAVIAIPAAAVPAHGQPEVRIGDITQLSGEQKNRITGLGFVTGLAGTGGTSENTKRAAILLLQRLGLRSAPLQRQLLLQLQEKTDNVSLVIVSAEMPAHAKRGQRIDVMVSAQDDAESLAGGVLVTTPLVGVDGEVYAVAGGPISINGGNFGGNAANVTKNHPTTGRIPGGAVVENEIPSTIFEYDTFHLMLNNPSYETARRVAESINTVVPAAAYIHDPAMVTVRIPPGNVQQPYEFVAICQEQLVIPDDPARVVINERTGTIVVGSSVRLSAVAITQGNLIVTTIENQQVSQPEAFSDGETTTVDRSEVQVTEPGGVVNVVQDTTTVGDLAASLNALGVSPRDLSSIFQALKEAGALHAQLEFH